MRPIKFASFALFAATALAAVLPTAARAGTYRVGTGCTYADLGAAMTYAAAHDFDDVVTFKLRTGTELTGRFGLTTGFADIDVVDPEWDIVIEGGYSDCSATTPTSFTTLQPSRAGYGHLRVENYTLVRRAITLRHLHFVDADLAALNFWDNVSAELVDVDVSASGYGISMAAYVETPAENWASVSLSGGTRIHDNAYGGIHGRGTVTLAHATVENNHATSGGGIAVNGVGSQIILDSSSGNNLIRNNVANVNGGGIYIYDGAKLLIKATSGGVNSISYNGAGITINPSIGYGGGIYSEQGDIEFHSGPANAGYHNLMNGNSANYGGAIAVIGANGGDGVDYTNVLLLNSQFGYNTAYQKGGALYSRNAVDWTIDHGSIPGCSADFPAPCSVFVSNQAENGGVDYDSSSEEPPQSNGGVIYITDERSDGYSRGIARFYHTLFTHNSDPQGAAAVAAADSSAELVFQRNVFDANDAYQLVVGTYMIDSHNAKNVNFRYNTVLPTNSTYYLLHTLGGTLDITGSVIETLPFLFGSRLPIWLGEGSAEVLHRGCLVSSVSLLDKNSDGGWVGDARIGVGFAPQGGSPALDHCDFTPPIDFYNRAGAVDTRGVPARYGNYDLGAVEQNDIIFYNDFGIRPNG